VVRLGSETLKTKEPKGAALQVVRAAITHNSRDNISCIVVDLNDQLGSDVTSVKGLLPGPWIHMGEFMAKWPIEYLKLGKSVGLDYATTLKSRYELVEQTGLLQEPEPAPDAVEKLQVIGYVINQGEALDAKFTKVLLMERKHWLEVKNHTKEYPLHENGEDIPPVGDERRIDWFRTMAEGLRKELSRDCDDEETWVGMTDTDCGMQEWP